MANQAMHNKTFTVEFEDGHLNIINVSESGSNSQYIIPTSQFTKDDKEDDRQEDLGDNIMQLMDNSKVVDLGNLMNLALVKCEDGVYRLVSSGSENATPESDTVTYVLEASNNEDDDDGSHDGYVVMDDERTVLLLDSDSMPEELDSSCNNTIKGDEEKMKTVTEQEDTHMIRIETLPNFHSGDIRMSNTRKIDLQSTNLIESETQEGLSKNKDLQHMSPTELLQRAKILEKNTIMREKVLRYKKYSAAKRKSDLPPPVELLSSPSFKLYLYSCKLCPFKCNAVKELTQHRKIAHRYINKYRGGCRLPNKPSLPLVVLTKEPKETGDDPIPSDILLCGACGFSASSVSKFRSHIEKEHIIIKSKSTPVDIVNSLKVD